MNYLAHIMLSPPEPAWWVGSLWPDMTKARPEDDVPVEVFAGIEAHRAVDRFTDTHPIVHQSRARLFAREGRYSGILLDLFYDHLLARHWQQWHHQPLHAFLDQVHEGLTLGQMWMPPQMKMVIERMIRQRWLAHYDTLEGIEHILMMMSHRFTQRFERQIDLQPAINTLKAHRNQLTSDFNAFFPQLQQHVESITQTTISEYHQS